MRAGMAPATTVPYPLYSPRTPSCCRMAWAVRYAPCRKQGISAYCEVSGRAAGGLQLRCHIAQAGAAAKGPGRAGLGPLDRAQHRSLPADHWQSSSTATAMADSVSVRLYQPTKPQPQPQPHSHSYSYSHLTSSHPTPPAPTHTPTHLDPRGAPSSATCLREFGHSPPSPPPSPTPYTHLDPPGRALQRHLPRLDDRERKERGGEAGEQEAAYHEKLGLVQPVCKRAGGEVGCNSM